MELGLKGQTALVTGGSKGIGRAIAIELASEGCNLHLAARTAEDLESAADEILKVRDVHVTIHPTDLSKGSNARALASETAGIDILVNNAGAIPGGSLLTVDEDTWREAWDLKVMGFINLTRAVYAEMRERKSGVIVNVIGTAGERPDSTYIAGSAGNASLMAFTRALGSRSPEHGVRVVGVNPGMTITERLERRQREVREGRGEDPDEWRQGLTHLPFGRAGEASEVADLVAFLASDRASYISGTVVTIDGGHSSRGVLA